jgi:ATP-dependent Lon protease
MYKKRLLEQETRSNDAPESDVYVSGNYKARKSMHSVDDQIDALILRYEKASISENDDLMESLTKKSLKFLFEQEEEEEPADEESEAAEPTGSEAMKAKKGGEQIVPNLNIDEFASRTVRLINNPSTLLDLRTAILNRVKNFLDENYGDVYVNRYLETLEQEFGIEISEFDNQDMEKTSDDIFAIGANPAGAGGS